MGRIELDKVFIELLQSNIVLVTPKDDCILDVEDIKKIKEANLEITNRKKYGIISFTGSNSGVTSDAREFLATKKIEKKNRLNLYCFQITTNTFIEFFH